MLPSPAEIVALFGVPFVRLLFVTSHLLGAAAKLKANGTLALKAEEYNLARAFLAKLSICGCRRRPSPSGSEADTRCTFSGKFCRQYDWCLGHAAEGCWRFHDYREESIYPRNRISFWPWEGGKIVFVQGRC